MSAASPPPPSAALAQALNAGQAALRRGEKTDARRRAWEALALAPEREEPWLLLAATASPRASLVYLQRALDINPNSGRARQGMHWAVRRWRASPAATRNLTRAEPTLSSRRLVARPIPTQALVRTRRPVLPYLVLACLLALFFNTYFDLPVRAAAILVRFSSAPAPRTLAQVNVQKETRTPTPTSTATFTPTPTATFTPTPTDTPTPTPTDTPLPTDTPRPKNRSFAGYSYPGRPGKVGPYENWIDVDLSSQRVFAYTGDSLQNNFLVSTGTWLHPTVTGTFRIYVKFRYADMAGPGYYLPDVPYVMYFYRGYGLHGTYWHNNFGTPMSHGCVNLRTGDAAWLFSFARVGTVVNVHR